MSERDHWLSITDDSDWKTRHCWDPVVDEKAALRAVTDWFPPFPKLIVDIGCGYGRMTASIARLYPDARVVGIDINPTLLEQALPGPIYWCQDTLQGLENCDVVYSVAVFQHLPLDEQKRYIDDAHAALNPGGRLVVQFIDGHRDNFCDHWTPEKLMREWFTPFRTVHVAHRLVHPQWSWITGIK